MLEIPSTQYWPFDGSSIDPAHLPLMTVSNTAPNRQPLLYPSQAFFLANCVKNMYLSISAFYETVSIGGSIGFETLATTNVIKRFNVPGNNVCPIKFQAVAPFNLATTQFVLDFSKGAFGLGKVLSARIFGFMPLATFNLAAAHGSLQAALPFTSDGTLNMLGFPSFKEGAIFGVGFDGVSNSPAFDISGVSILTSNLQLTERIDSIYFDRRTSKPGETVSMICPPVSSTFDSTSYRSGFADLRQISINGAPPLTKGTILSDTQFVLSSQNTGIGSVLDTATFIVPQNAQNGRVGLTLVTDISNPTNTSDFFNTEGELTIFR